MTRINSIWMELVNDESYSRGLLLRRYSGSVLLDLFIAIENPEKFLCVAICVDESINVDISAFGNLREIQVDLLPHPNQNGKIIILFKLLNNQHKDIFSVLCEDLIASVATETNEAQLVVTILNRFEKWKSLFIKLGLHGLLPEEQRGLFGEIFLLRKLLHANFEFQNIISSWIGSSKETKDFQIRNWALEVKTTHGNNHQKVHINNERQLDITHIQNLFLYHISLESVQESGESLNDLINSVYSILDDDVVALNQFKAKLYEAGYFEQHYELYNSTGYFIRNDIYYKIENDFPRIQENEIRSGVGDVKYSIILSQCDNYKRSEKYVFEILSNQ